VIYPKNGQTREQQAADQFECHNWAKGQTGFDPTLPGGGVSGSADAARNNYSRAMSACMQGRGYQIG
jgi:ribosomal protein S9